MKNSTIIILMVIAFIGGCANAQLISTSDQLGGVRDGPRWGIVKYRSSGIMASSHQARAREVMASYCAPGSYRVLGVSDGPDGAVLVGNSVIGVNSAHVRFECVR